MVKHHCHALNCPNPCAAKLLMCGSCWALVGPETKVEVYRTVKLRDMSGCDHTWAPWWRASHQAIYEVAVAQGLDGQMKDDGTPWSAAAWLVRQMEIADELEKDK